MLRPITIEELKKRIKDIHGDTVLLDESTYIDFSSKCFFIDKDYGRWECLPNNVARGHGHKLRGKQIAKKKTTISIEDTKKEIYKLYGNTITLDESTFVNRHTKAKFIDIDYGEWWATPSHVISDNSGHPARRNLKISEKNTKNTILIAKEIANKNGGFCLSDSLDRAGYSVLKWRCICGHKWEQCLNHIIYDKTWCPVCSFKRSCNNFKNSGISSYWKTGEPLVWHYNYEKMVIEFLNNNKKEYIWQPKTFITPLKTKKGKFRTYRIDLYLIKEDLWVEIKGYFRKDALEKWNWFHKEYPNSELWDKIKLEQLGIL